MPAAFADVVYSARAFIVLLLSCYFSCRTNCPLSEMNILFWRDGLLQLVCFCFILFDFEKVGKMRVAIIHDWLVTYAGAEKVLNAILDLYPDADLYSIVDFLDEKDRARLHGKHSNTSFIQKFPFAKSRYRYYLAIMPFAIEQFDLAAYDLVISSSHAVAKGVITGPDQLHICYCHSPIRYAWDMQGQYLHESGLEKGLKSWIARWVLHNVRLWDYRTANGVDCFVANSDYIGRRIRKVYGRASLTVYPGIALNDFSLTIEKEDFYLAASRLVPYKKMDLIVRAFADMPDKKLVVIGDGPQMENVRRAATSNVRLMGYQKFEVLRDFMQRAKAFVFAAEEDFGIIPVEAQACGTPVIAFGKGGALETVIDGETGLFFREQSEVALREAVLRFEKECDFDPVVIRKNAERFSIEIFKRELAAIVDENMESLIGELSGPLNHGVEVKCRSKC